MTSSSAFACAVGLGANRGKVVVSSRRRQHARYRVSRWSLCASKEAEAEAAADTTVAPSTALDALADRVAKLPAASGSDAVELFSLSADGAPPLRCTVRNQPGSTASFRIFEHFAREYVGVFGPAAARDALEVYGDVVDEARAQPGLHPNIDFLLQLASGKETYVVKVDGEYLA